MERFKRLFASILLVGCSATCWAADSLQIVAWNIGAFESDQQSLSNLVKSLQTIVEDPDAPQLLLLLEVNPQHLKGLLSQPFRLYGYDKFTVLEHAKLATADRELYVAIWKSSSLELHDSSSFILNHDLPEFYPKDLEAKQKKADYLSFLEKAQPRASNVIQHRLSFRSHHQHDFDLYPVHFSNIWPASELYLNGKAQAGARNWLLPESIEEKIASTAAKAYVARELLFGTQNPLYSQGMSLLKEIEKDAGIEKRSSLVVGDFNAFPHLFGADAKKLFLTMGSMKARICSDFEKSFRPVYAPQPQYSFPAQSFLEANPDYERQMLIDLAYTRGDIWAQSSAKVLKLEGSDHYPLLYTFELAPKVDASTK